MVQNTFKNNKCPVWFLNKLTKWVTVCHILDKVEKANKCKCAVLVKTAFLYWIKDSRNSVGFIGDNVNVVIMILREQLKTFVETLFKLFNHLHEHFIITSS